MSRRDEYRTVGQRIESLKTMLLTGTDPQRSLARKLLRELSKTSRNTKDVQAALAALSSETPKDSAGVVTHPEAPEFIMKSPEGFTPNEIVGRRLAGLEVKRGATLLDRAENGDPAAIAELRDLYFFADPRFIQQAEEFNADLWSGLQSSLHHPAERPPRTCIFSEAELERARKVLGENARQCRPMLGRVVEHVWSLIDIVRSPHYHEILRLTGRAGACEDILKLREVEQKILAAPDDLALRLVLYEALGEQPPAAHLQYRPEQNYQPAPPEWNRHLGF